MCITLKFYFSNVITPTLSKYYPLWVKNENWKLDSVDYVYGSPFKFEQQKWSWDWGEFVTWLGRISENILSIFLPCQENKLWNGFPLCSEGNFIQNYCQRKITCCTFAKRLHSLPIYTSTQLLGELVEIKSFSVLKLSHQAYAKANEIFT